MVAGSLTTHDGNPPPRGAWLLALIAIGVVLGVGVFEGLVWIVEKLR